MWHEPGVINGSEWMEPTEFWENSHTKRRIHNLLSVSGLVEQLVPIKARVASEQEVTRFHTQRYHDQIQHDSLRNGGDGGELAPFSRGGYGIACLSAGGVLAATEAVLEGKVENAYCLVRPPGHHAEADRGRGFCIFNNVAIAALHARTLGHAAQRIAIVDYDVHHGNGTQEAFWNDPDCLFISLHQDCNYPQDSGLYTEIGGENAIGSTINVPLPPGSGTGCYAYAFQRIVIPALERFKPDMIFVSSGFDASYADPLASMMLSSEAFRDMATQLVSAARRLCQGRIVFAHEGGYSKDYVPFCGLAVIEALSGLRSPVEDDNLCEVNLWGYQSLQAHQAALINKVADYHHLPFVSSGSVETDKAMEQSVQELQVAQQMQALLESITDPERRKVVLQSLSF